MTRTAVVECDHAFVECIWAVRHTYSIIRHIHNLYNISPTSRLNLPACRFVSLNRQCTGWLSTPVSSSLVVLFSTCLILEHIKYMVCLFHISLMISHYMSVSLVGISCGIAAGVTCILGKFLVIDKFIISVTAEIPSVGRFIIIFLQIHFDCWNQKCPRPLNWQ